MFRRLCVVLALCLLVAPAGAGAQTAAPLTTIKVGIIPVDSAAEAFYAVDMGFFKKQGLDVDLQIMQNGASIASAVAGGSLDIGFADLISIASAHARGLPFVYLAPTLLNTYAAPTLAVMVNGSGPIREAKDLNNKTITVNGINNITMIPTEAWIDKSGGDSKTIKWIELPIPAADDAVATGKVDAAITGEPFVTFGVDKGLRALYADKNAIAPRYALAGFMTTKEWAAKNPQLAAKFIAAIKETAQWANTNRAATSPILSKYTKLPVAVVERMRRGDFAETLLVSDFQPVIDAAAKYGVLPKSFPAAEFSTSSRACARSGALTAEQAIVDVFERRSAAALFVTEVQYGIAPQRDPAEFAAALQHLIEAGEIIIVTKPAPDVHLNDADLRIVARNAPDAAEAVESAWRGFLREFLQSHRCS